MKKETKLEDFGKKIGGARKDVWAPRGLRVSDILEMTEGEQTDNVKRDNIWPRNKFTEGTETERVLSYWRNQIRLSIYPKPSHACQGSTEKYEQYINGVRYLKEEAEQVTSEQDVERFYDKMVNGVVTTRVYGENYYRLHYYVNDNYKYIVDGKKFLKFSSDKKLTQLKKQMNKENYGLTRQQILEKNYIVKKYNPSAGHTCIKEMDGACSLVYDIITGSYYFKGDSSMLHSLKEGDYALIDIPAHKVITCGSNEHCTSAMENIIKEELAEEQDNKPVRKRQTKAKWIPPQLARIHRSGEDYRHGKDVDGQMFMDTFGIRGGEFGNWENSAERQTSLNMAFDAFKDLARILNIPESDVSLPGLSLGSLAIAFGARGNSNASAHYEVNREVINITKINGAGSLGHEWAHALDDRIAKYCMIRKGSACDETYTLMLCADYPKSLKPLIETMKYSNVSGQVYTNYFQNSQAFDNAYNGGKEYWTSKHEMFARAFACYVLDKGKEKGIRNDYLTGHAETNIMPNSGLCAYPEGEERKAINNAFDTFFVELKEMEILHDFNWSENHGNEEEEELKVAETSHMYDSLQADETGQLCLPQ